MRFIWGISLTATAALVIACTQVSLTGHAVYDEHCVMCHGPSGKGDGDFADKLLKLPPDLTVLAANNNGDFPREWVQDAILGTGRGDHFSGAMPEFSDVAGQGTLADHQLTALLNYLASIQEPG